MSTVLPANGNFPTYRFYITHPVGTVTYEVFPLNFLETSLIDELEDNQIFYRRKFNGSLTFGTDSFVIDEHGVKQNRKDDYTLLKGIEDDDACLRLAFLITKTVSGVTTTYWEGYFSTSMGSWNLDDCTFSITPLLTDDYTSWDDFGDEQYNIISVAPSVTVECNGWSYTRNRWLFDVIEAISDNVFLGCTVSSRFFTEATDYVTNLPSKLLYLTIAQKSDIKNPVSSDPATVAMMSFNELMDILRGMFNVYWTFDLVTNTITIEHLSDFNYVSGIDLRTQLMSVKSNKYRYLTEEMPKHEYWRSMEAKSADFIYGHAWYDQLCVNQDPKTNVWEYQNRVTTEIEYIQQSILDGNEGSISNDGFVILCNYLEGGVYYTYQMAGLYDTTIRFNMPLAWSYLLQNYHRHGRVILEGFFNLTPMTFVSAKKTKVQDINAIICIDDGYDPSEYITTELGETYFAGEKGYVGKANIKPSGEVNFTLKYGPVDNADSGPPAEPKSLRVLQVDLEIYTYLSEANIYDTYFSIWTNSDTCDVIMIPAGTMYQHDTLTQINPIATIAYNFSDSSLTGWSKSVNNSTSYTTCTDVQCDSGAPAPPAVPDVPDITGHTQSTTCGPVRVNWTAEADATYYVLQRNPNLSGTASWETIYSGSGIFHDDYNAGLQEGVTFLYRVAAGNISGLSAWSAEHTVNDIMC